MAKAPTFKGKSMKLGGGGKAAKLKASLPKGMSAYEKGAIVGIAGRKKYGNKAMAKMSAAGRKRSKK